MEIPEQLDLQLPASHRSPGSLHLAAQASSRVPQRPPLRHQCCRRAEGVFLAGLRLQRHHAGIGRASPATGRRSLPIHLVNANPLCISRRVFFVLQLGYLALPLRDVEVDFAIDSSGFASTAYHRWLDHKYGALQKAVKWVKLHIMCGVQSNIITAADATASMSADSPYLPDFLSATAEHFRIRDVSADMAYSSRRNLHAVADLGGTPYIPFKTGAVAKPKSGKADPLWTQMYHHFTLRQADFNRHYHKRSNVETCFHMIKAKFGEKVRAKSDTAMVNEVLMRVLCHNVCVLIRSMYALGITPVFDDGTFAPESALDAKVTAA